MSRETSHGHATSILVVTSVNSFRGGFLLIDIAVNKSQARRGGE